MAFLTGIAVYFEPLLHAIYYPTKVPLKVFAILFKVLTAYCGLTPRAAIHANGVFKALLVDYKPCKPSGMLQREIVCSQEPSGVN